MGLDDGPLGACRHVGSWDVQGELAWTRPK